MNRIIKSITIIGAMFSLAGCFKLPTTKGYAQELRNPEKLSHSYKTSDIYEPEYLAFKEKVKIFSSKISESFAKRYFSNSENIILSPLSIEMCLGLAISSSSGVTRQELLNVFGVDFETFNKYYKLFYNECSRTIINSYDKAETGKLLLTNSIWIDDEVKLLDKGLDNLMNDYYSYSYNVDFNNKNKQANQAIRDFNKEKTNGLIDEDLKITPDVMFVLMNTLYLKDIWNEAGRDLEYAEDKYKFVNYDGKESSKRLLNGYFTSGRAMQEKDYSAFFSRTHSGFNLFFIKPNGKDIKDVFNQNTINHVINNKNYVYKDDDKLEIYNTACIFPEFSAYTNTDLAPIFQQDYNVKTLFNLETCDFSNLSKDKVYCTDFKQISKLEVNKTGIEGAAVTYMAYAGSAGPGEYTIVDELFVVDESFGYVLTTPQGDVIFSGIVTNID